MKTAAQTGQLFSFGPIPAEEQETAPRLIRSAGISGRQSYAEMMIADAQTNFLKLRGLIQTHDFQREI